MTFAVASIYDRQRTGKLVFIVVAVIAVIIFLLVSNNLVKQLGQQEKERMDIWAQSTERLAKADVNADFEFLLSIISQNNSIPVLVTDSAFNILEHRNFPLPDKDDKEKFIFSELSDKNKEYLNGRLRKAAGAKPLHELALTNQHFIEVEIFGGAHQYIYYEDSILLRRLSMYPYIQIVAMVILAIIIYVAVLYTKRAEQNRVWAGLSKETAHQLGTPISSLMAWTQFLEASGTDPDIVGEIDKDVKRLSTIAQRFSKIGSRPELQLEYLNETVSTALQYMRSRVSGKVEISLDLARRPCRDAFCLPFRVGDGKPHQKRRRCYGRFRLHCHNHWHRPRQGVHRSQRHRERNSAQELQERVQPRLHHKKTRMGTRADTRQTHNRRLPPRTDIRQRIGNRERDHVPHRDSSCGVMPPFFRLHI